MKRIYPIIFFVIALLSACDNNDPDPKVTAPPTYSFERDGLSTVSFSGQTTRIKMGEELISAMKDFSVTEGILLEMFRNQTAGGGDANPFDDADLNTSDKSIKSKTAASRDFFSANATESAEIKADFEAWIMAQVNEVFPNENTVAAPGTPGQIADGSSTRYVNAMGLEYDQMVGKGLIGALMSDQALNNYLSPSVLDEGDNVVNNDNQIKDGDKNYTTMEHKWDEAFGYFYGISVDPSDPNETIGQDDSFINKYIGRVENDPDFTGIADEIFDAFKLGRAAIVEGEYTLRDRQAEIIQEKLSEIIAIRAVYYLQQGKLALPADRNDFNLYGGTLHDLSEGYGFIYSLRFTRQPGTEAPYFSKAEVDGFINDLLGDGPNGLWDVETATLDAISASIAAKFDFTVEEAGS
jgi:hypothetical protein